jgi:hypothetical protein
MPRRVARGVEYFSPAEVAAADAGEPTHPESLLDRAALILDRVDDAVEACWLLKREVDSWIVALPGDRRGR